MTSSLYGPMPSIPDPRSLRVGIDVVTVACRPCMWLGYRRGRAVVMPQGAALPVLVPAHLVHEPEPLPLATVDWEEFQEGFLDGYHAQAMGRQVGRLSQGRIPTPYGRGYVLGDEHRGTVRASDRPAFHRLVVACYNAMARDLVARYPKEHRWRKPLQRRSPDA